MIGPELVVELQCGALPRPQDLRDGGRGQAAQTVHFDAKVEGEANLAGQDAEVQSEQFNRWRRGAGATTCIDRMGDV